MSEIQRYADSILSVDVKKDGIQDGVNEKKIKEFARNYILREQRTLPPDQLKALVGRVIELIEQQDISLENLNARYEHEKQEVIKEARIARMRMDRPTEFSGVQSIGDVSYVIDAKSAESMQILEEMIGLDSPDTAKGQAKILLLVMAHTTMELGKGLADILKIGEGTAEGSLALDRNDLTILQKTWEMTKGIGTDGLRALGLAGTLKLVGTQLSGVLGKMKLPKSLFANLINNLSSGGPRGPLYYQEGAIKFGKGPARKAGEVASAEVQKVSTEIDAVSRMTKIIDDIKPELEIAKKLGKLPEKGSTAIDLALKEAKEGKLGRLKAIIRVLNKSEIPERMQLRKILTETKQRLQHIKIEGREAKKEYDAFDKLFDTNLNSLFGKGTPRYSEIRGDLLSEIKKFEKRYSQKPNAGELQEYTSELIEILQSHGINTEKLKTITDIKSYLNTHH